MIQDRAIDTMECKYETVPYQLLVVWLSGNALASINVVALYQTRLVPGWVTVCGQVNHRCQFSERNWKLTYFSNLIRTLFCSLLWFFVAIVVLEIICYLGHVKKCNVMSTPPTLLWSMALLYLYLYCSIEKISTLRLNSWYWKFLFTRNGSNKNK